MSFVVYLLVLVIAAGSVLFGLDWTSAPMSPMPASKYQLHAAKEPAKAPAPVVADAKPATKTEAKIDAGPGTKPAAVPVQTVSPPQPVQATAAAPAPEPVAAPETVADATPPAPKCDIDACAAAYRSFTPADCTYQPFDGPRQLCTKGTPPTAAAEATPPTLSPAATPDARAQATCNVSACSQAYISFTASDCTYQPLDGPRRICTK